MKYIITVVITVLLTVFVAVGVTYVINTEFTVRDCERRGGIPVQANKEVICIKPGSVM